MLVNSEILPMHNPHAYIKTKSKKQKKTKKTKNQKIKTSVRCKYAHTRMHHWMISQSTHSTLTRACMQRILSVPGMPLPSPTCWQPTLHSDGFGFVSVQPGMLIAYCVVPIALDSKLNHCRQQWRVRTRGCGSKSCSQNEYIPPRHMPLWVSKRFGYVESGS